MSSGALQVTLWVPFSDLFGPSYNRWSASYDFFGAAGDLTETLCPLEAPSDLCGVPIDHSGALRHLPVAPSHLLEAHLTHVVPCDSKGTPSDLLGV